MLLLFTLSIVLLSSMLLLSTLTKKKRSLCENLVRDNNMQKSEFEPSLADAAPIEDIQESESSKYQGEAESYPSYPLESESNNIIIDKKIELNAQKYEQQDDPYSDSSYPSDSESSIGSIIGESFEIDLRINQDMSLSDSFASDNDDEDEEGEDEEEDGLIEIKLPSSNFSSLNEEYSKQNIDFVFKEQGLMDLLAEINDEDENLIEIDIFNGSTKYQDFRFKELACLGDQCVLSD
jgi:hypothetical protein